MRKFNLRKELYFALAESRGQHLRAFYNRIEREEREGTSPETTRALLIQLLDFSKKMVPYYGKIIEELGDSFYHDPEDYLLQFPILTKEILRKCFDELKSNDLANRHWSYNSSGGSTGVPVRLIQDWDFSTQAGSVSLIFSKVIGREIGETEIHLWGSAHDITQGSEKLRARLVNWLTRNVMLNSFHMTPEKMRDFLQAFNRMRPKLIIAYAESIYELANFAEKEQIKVVPQRAIISTAGTLYPFMREKVEKVFQCKVYNRYGSREVGDIACERPGVEGLWIAPWGNYVEVVDEKGRRVPDGEEGEILITNLTNYAMPLIRYRIGDRGIISPEKYKAGLYLPTLEKVSGRTADCFLKRDGSVIPPEFFIHMVGVELNTGWIRKYQVVQEEYDHIRIMVVQAEPVDHPEEVHQNDMARISSVMRKVMGQDCQVEFHFTDDIAVTANGKYRYTISNITH